MGHSLGFDLWLFVCELVNQLFFQFQKLLALRLQTPNMGAVCHQVCDPRATNSQIHPDTNSTYRKHVNDLYGTEPSIDGEQHLDSESDALDSGTEPQSNRPPHAQDESESISHHNHEGSISSLAAISITAAAKSQFEKSIKNGNEEMVHRHIEIFGEQIIDQVRFYRNRTAVHYAVVCKKYNILAVLLQTNPNVQ